METTLGEPTNYNRVGTITLESICKLMHVYAASMSWPLFTLSVFPLSQDNFIQYLLNGTKNLNSVFALQNTDTMSHIINCSTGILLLADKKCDLLTNPNPTVGSDECVTVILILQFIRLYANDGVFLSSSLCLSGSLRSFGLLLSWWVQEIQIHLSWSTEQALSTRERWYFFQNIANKLYIPLPL